MLPYTIWLNNILTENCVNLITLEAAPCYNTKTARVKCLLTYLKPFQIYLVCVYWMRRKGWEENILTDETTLCRKGLGLKTSLSLRKTSKGPLQKRCVFELVTPTDIKGHQEDNLTSEVSQRARTAPKRRFS